MTLDHFIVDYSRLFFEKFAAVCAATYCGGPDLLRCGGPDEKSPSRHLQGAVVQGHRRPWRALLGIAWPDLRDAVDHCRSLKRSQNVGECKVAPTKWLDEFENYEKPKRPYYYLGITLKLGNGA